MAGLSPCITCKKSCRGTECRACWKIRKASAPYTRVLTLAKRFWEKVDTSAGPHGCWPWTGGRKKTGYGLFWVETGMNAAHRVAWSLKHGPVPSGKWVLHSCDNPPCCNDAHLFLGTHIVNMKDKAKKGRAPRGEHNANSKLTVEAVQKIRRLTQDGLSRRKIAVQVGIDESTVSRIARGKTWKHLT